MIPHTNSNRINLFQLFIFCLHGRRTPRALVRDADIIIMDEPTSALDTALSEQIVENLNNYLSQNETILIVVSHRPEILEICNKTIELT